MSQYISLSAVQSPFYIGPDEMNRHVFSVNFNIVGGGPIAAMAQEVAKLISDNGLGTSGTDMFIGNTVPTGNGPFILLIPTGGRSTILSHDDERLERPSLQILVRATVYPTAEARIMAIYRLIDGVHNIALTA